MYAVIVNFCDKNRPFLFNYCVAMISLPRVYGLIKLEYQPFARYSHFYYIFNGPNRGRGPALPPPLGRLGRDLVHTTTTPHPTPRYPLLPKIFSVLLYDQPFTRYGHI